jgi:hypothetical protein
MAIPRVEAGSGLSFQKIALRLGRNTMNQTGTACLPEHSSIRLATSCKKSARISCGIGAANSVSVSSSSSLKLSITLDPVLTYVCRL